jgi:putative ATPase
LPDVEEGIVTLVGATTSNPFFAVISALVSRSQVFEFQPLAPDEIKTLVLRALADEERGLGRYEVRMHDDALEYLAQVSEGDARRALAALEIGVLSHRSPHAPREGNITRSVMPTVEFTRELAAESVQRKAAAYDPTGDEHYDSISALIKSIRGSDPDAGLYWLARMLEAGEDVRFLCRRLVILASEDVGNADPHALPLAVAAMQACEFVGLPECQLPLAQAVTYLACAPKSNAATLAIGEARSDVREGRTLPVPVHLRDQHYPGAARLGHGQGYEYAHDAEGGIAAQDYLGVEREYYRPVSRGFEAELAQRLEKIRERLRAGRTP